MSKIGLPTSWGDWRRMGRATRLVLVQPRWGVTAVLVALVVLTLGVLPVNLGFVEAVIVGGDLPFGERIGAFVELYPLVGGASEPIREGLMYVVSGIVGINVGLLGYHVLEHDVGIREGSASTTGAVLATLGAGCPVCGASIAAGGFSTIGVTSLTVLPLEGLEIMLGGIVAGLLGVHWLVEGMRGGEIRGCPVDRPD